MNEIESAIRRLTQKCFRYRDGGYQAYTSENNNFLGLGTFKTGEEAHEAVVVYKVNRLARKCAEHGLNVEDGRLYKERYAVFASGDIFNLNGIKIKPAIMKSGYEMVVVGGKATTVHRIVAELFVSNPMCLREVNHINGIKSDNRAENLEWCTRSQNQKHAYETGLEKRVYGEKHHSHKLVSKDVEYIRSVYKARDKKYGANALANEFGVCRATIGRIANRKVWNHIT